MKDDIFFLPLFIKEKIYLIGKDELVFVETKQTNVEAQNEMMNPAIELNLSDEIKQTTPTNPFLILHEEIPPLPAPQEELLANILKAINIPLHQVEKRFVGEAEQTNLHKRRFIFVFSSSIPLLFTSMEKNKVRLISENTKALIADSLTDLTNDKQKKIALWTELKKNIQT
jgi:DNA polymerase III psi subunit